MKKVIAILVLTIGVVLNANAQDSMVDKSMKTIELEQTPGEFTKKSLTVNEGTYVFEIKNNGIDHNVGFVLVKKGKDISKPENHIQTAYVTAPVKTGDTQKSKPTKLEKGEYIYFCPLNPTATDNLLIVE
ncbi:plastocyanin/azurin family copper-binding protein [Allomuricauda sp. SCSIO 65647]|uniref:plastocyanin/azurin family copper-binding protein n=1 Tax=Allomuricauda sp. SCSIO 65647 TaxID=2908843 RepID=UPI001F3A6EEC|nr:plastocyanin/azurin family copper-binding protein [Muricauda sp. SCSIO 65647]UJH69227.1 cupredoxin domain-containing protein [Muricauda sp. SCSIO 65647]